MPFPISGGDIAVSISEHLTTDFAEELRIDSSGNGRDEPTKTICAGRGVVPLVVRPIFLEPFSPFGGNLPKASHEGSSGGQARRSGTFRGYRVTPIEQQGSDGARMVA